jgi:hypothetical protein
LCPLKPTWTPGELLVDIGKKDHKTGLGIFHVHRRDGSSHGYAPRPFTVISGTCLCPLSGSLRIISKGGNDSV